MKKIVYLFLFCGYFAFSQEYKIENEELKGNIKTSHLSLLEKDNVIPVEIKNYDKKGRIILLKTFYNGKIATTERNQYLDGQIITEVCDYCDDLDKAFANFSIKEDEKSPYKGFVTNNPRRTFKFVKSTDKKGNIISLKTYSSEGYLLSETKSTYDKNANLLLEETFADNGKKEPEFKKNIYNKKGQLIETVNVMNHHSTKYVYEYNPQGKRITEKEWQGDTAYENSYEYSVEKDTTKVLVFGKKSTESENILRTMDLTYPEKDKKINKRIRLDNGKPSNTEISKFDKNNNLILKQNFNDKEEMLSETKLVYDTKGNWTQMDYSYLVNASYNGSEPKPEWRTKTYIRKIEYQ